MKPWCLLGGGTVDALCLGCLSWTMEQEKADRVADMVQQLSNRSKQIGSTPEHGVLGGGVAVQEALW